MASPLITDDHIPENVSAEAAPSITANIQGQASQTNGQIANSYMNAGASGAKGLLNAPNNINGGLSYGDNATTAAIKSRMNSGNALNQGQLKVSTMQQADADHLRNLQTATQAAGQEVAMNKQKAILAWNIDQQNKKANGAILGTTLGIVGGVVGAYAGGAGGAVAGYQAGQGVGNAVGSANG